MQVSPSVLLLASVSPMQQDSSMKTLYRLSVADWPTGRLAETPIGRRGRQSSSERHLREDRPEEFQAAHVTCEVAPLETAVRRWWWTQVLSVSSNITGKLNSQVVLKCCPLYPLHSYTLFFRACF